MLKTRIAVAVSIFFAALNSTSAYAACATLPYTFTNGTTADANQVMSNFNYFSGCAAPLASPSFTGNVGIGTTTPLETLQITNSGSYGLVLYDTSQGSNGKGWDFESASGTLSFRAISDNLSAAANWLTVSRSGLTVTTVTIGAIQTLNVLNNGGVGIGTANPGYTLQVIGSVAGTSAYVTTSDARYKKNVKPLEIGLNEIKQLKPVSFEWKEDILDQTTNGKEHHRALDPMMEGNQMGFIAQDVEKVLPSVVVTEKNAEKTKGMKYSELIPVLVKAVQEQQDEISSLKQQIEDLKKPK